MTPYWIFIIFLLTLGLTNSVYAEPKDVEIDWIIEGQILPENSSSNEYNSESSDENDSVIKEQIENFLSTENELVETIEEDFITGSGCTIGNRIITIDSEEGQALNKLLIEQKKLNRDNFFHMIKYLDRYSDGYVELAEALLDPVRIQNYQQKGMNTNYNVNSNLEHFLFERGF